MPRTPLAMPGTALPAGLPLSAKLAPPKQKSCLWPWVVSRWNLLCSLYRYILPQSLCLNKWTGCYTCSSHSNLHRTYRSLPLISPPPVYALPSISYIGRFDLTIRHPNNYYASAQYTVSATIQITTESMPFCFINQLWYCLSWWRALFMFGEELRVEFKLHEVNTIYSRRLCSSFLEEQQHCWSRTTRNFSW